MARSIYDVPGLSGFLQAKDASRAQESGELQQYAAVTSLADAMAQRKRVQQKAERESAAQAELIAIGGVPTTEQIMGIAAKYGSPEFALKAIETTSALNRAATKEKQDHEYRMSTLRTTQERNSEIERHNRAVERLGLSGGSPYFTPVYDTTGVLSFNARTGTAAPLVVDGRQAVRPTDDPTRQRDLAGAKAGGAAEGQAAAERRFNMSGIGQIIQQADDILSGVRRQDGVVVPADRPTQSGAGAALDYAGSLVGYSPTGAVEAQQLKALGGALTAKMPRMEGPQGVADVLLYQQMAAEVGDSTVPIERRKAALQTVKQLWARYEKAGGGQPSPEAPQKISTDAEYNALPSGAEYIAPDGKLRRKK